MVNAPKRLLAIAAVAAMWVTVQPAPASAQTSGSNGRDGSTVIRWIGTSQDGTFLSLWKLDGFLKFVASQQYGPYPGFTPIAITTASNGNTYVLWRFQDNSIILWVVDPNLDFVTSHAYGPYAGWFPQGLSVDTDGFNNFRVTWLGVNDGSAIIWEVDPNLNFVTASPVLGPVAGWYSGALP